MDEGVNMRESGKRAAVCLLVAILGASLVPAFAMAPGTEGQIWLDCEPCRRSIDGGWQAGGMIFMPESLDPNGFLAFDLLVTNRDNVDQTSLRIPLAIHSLYPPTTGDDLQWVRLTAPDGTATTIALGDFGTSEYNPFDDGSGGRHHVYFGPDAIWKNYAYPAVLAEDETARIRVEVQLGPDPGLGFEIHFDAFDLGTGAKTPNGHDVTLTTRGAQGPGEPPIACIAGGDAITVYEGDRVTFDGSCSSDPDGTIVTYEWDFDLAVDSDGDGDPTNDVDATGPVVSFTWFDDYESEVMLTVTDDEGLTASAVQTVTVLNLDPAGRIVGAFVEFNLTIRMAGKKWSNVNVDVYTGYNRTTGTYDALVGSMEVERWPGSPDKNPTGDNASLPLRADVTGGTVLTAVVAYDPYADSGDLIRGDQPVSGQVWGDNPIWLVLAFPDGGECRIKHNFNVRQSLDRNRDTPAIFAEPWIVDLLTGACVGRALSFVATAVEFGTDDITFTWDFGDGAIASTAYLYDAARGPDPAFPPGSPYEPYAGGFLPPLNLVDTAYHTYAAAGTYTVTLTINDDDGGAWVTSFDVVVADAVPCK